VILVDPPARPGPGLVIVSTSSPALGGRMVPPDPKPCETASPSAHPSASRFPPTRRTFSPGLRRIDVAKRITEAGLLIFETGLVKTGASLHTAASGLRTVRDSLRIAGPGSVKTEPGLQKTGAGLRTFTCIRGSAGLVRAAARPSRRVLRPRSGNDNLA
jgi:hypothetical protein